MKEQLDAAKALINDGQAEQAYTLLEKLHEKKPQAPAPLLNMARALIAMDKLEEAQQTLEQVLKLRPENGPAMIMLQRLLQTMGDEVGSQKLALKMVNNATEASGTVTKLYTHLLRNRANAGQTNEIDAALRHAVHLVKDDPKLLRVLLDQAVTFTDPAILSALVKTSDKSDVHRQDLAMTLHQKYGEYAPILAGLRANFTGTRSAEDALKAGQALLGVGRLATGRRYLRLCLHKWPENTPIFFVYVHALIRSGRYETAINVLRDRLNLDAPTGFLRLSNQLLVTLCLNRNFEDAQALREKLGIQDDANRTALGLYLHQIIETGDLSLAMAESQALRAGASTRSQAHWGLTLHSQLLTELRLMSPDDLATARRADFDETRDLTKAAPGSTFLAHRMITHWVNKVQNERAMQGQAAEQQDSPIPKMIYQYWDQPEVPAQITSFTNSWIKAAGFEHTLYNREQAIALLRAEFGPRWVQAFRMTNNPAEESDLLRLCLLAKNGGIWADADDVLYGTLTGPLSGGFGLVGYQDTVGGATANNFIAVRPRHPAIVYAAKLARASLLQKSGETAWFRTGPGILTRAIARYIASAKPEVLENDLKLIPHHILLNDIAMTNPAAYKFSSKHWARQEKDEPIYQELLKQALTT